MGLEDKTGGEGSLNLEKLAEQLGNMQERHKMDQLRTTVMDGFVNAPGVKYKDERGVEHYKTKFTAAESNKIADNIFDKLAYHIHLRRYPGMSVDFFNQLKTHKDIDGNPLMDAEIEKHLGISKASLRKMLLDNRENLTTDHFNSMVDDMLKTHMQAVAKPLYAQVTNEHRDALAKYIESKAGSMKLKGYTIKKSDTINELLPKYQKLANAIYRKD